MAKLVYDLYRMHFNFSSNFVSLCYKECRLLFFKMGKRCWEDQYVDLVGRIAREAVRE